MLVTQDSARQDIILYKSEQWQNHKAIIFHDSDWEIRSHSMTTTTQTRPAGMRTFVFIWIGQVVSLLGTGMTRFAVTLWAWQLTGQATALALVGFFAFAPQIIFSPLAGALVDRWDRKLVMMLSDLMAGLATIVIFILSVTGQLALWHLYLATAFASSFEAFQFPAYSAAITTMVDKKHYARTSAMLGLAQSASNIFAPIFAAALFAFIGLSGILVIDIVTFIFALMSLVFVHIPPAKRSSTGAKSRGNLWSESIYGFRYIMAQRSLFGLQMVFFFGNLFFALTLVLVNPMILARTANNEAILAAVSSALGIGGFLGGLVMSTWGGFKRKVNGVLSGFILASTMGVMVLGLGQMIVIWVLGAFFNTFFTPLINASNQAIWQSKVPPDVQGKVFAARRMIAQITMPISLLAAGPLADFIFEPGMQADGALANLLGGLVGTGDGAGMGLMFVIFGGLTAVVGIVGYLLPFIRNVEAIVPDFDEDNEADVILAGQSSDGETLKQRLRRYPKTKPKAS